MGLVEHVGPGDGHVVPGPGNGLVVGDALAGRDGVGLGDGALADLFQHQVAVLVGDVGLVDQGPVGDGEVDVGVAVGFEADPVHGAGEGLALINDLQPVRVVDVVP